MDKDNDQIKDLSKNVRKILDITFLYNTSLSHLYPAWLKVMYMSDVSKNDESTRREFIVDVGKILRVFSKIRN